MKKTLLMSAALAAFLIGAHVASYAMDDAKTEAAQSEGVAAEHEAATDEAAGEVEVQELTLENGTKVHVKGEEVFVVDEDGNEMPAPDGEHTLEDGETITTEDGKIVE